MASTTDKAAPKAASKRPSRAKKKPVNGFRVGEQVVYPAHGVGSITAIEEETVAGYSLELFVLEFAKDKMRLKVPVAKAKSVGMRALADEDFLEQALKVLRGRARVKKTMWSRRAQEYDAKINSGDLIYIAEVVRDLYRAEDQPEQSYSERQLYEAALDRMSREIAAVRSISETEGAHVIEANLKQGPRRGAKGAEDEADNEDVAEEAPAAPKGKAA